MKIAFKDSKIENGIVKVSLDGGFTFTDYEIADVKETGISLDDSQDYEKIIIKGPSNVLKCLDVITKLKLESENYYFDLTKSTEFPSCVTRVPNGVTKIDNTAFWGCTSLTSITIPNSVTAIGEYAFQNCTNLKTINYKRTEEQWNAISKYNTWNHNCPSDMIINYNYQG